MSVAIIALPAKLPPSSQPAERASSTDASAPGADFASLLLGQLAVGTDFSPIIVENAQLLPERDTSAAIGTEQPPLDAAAMLAALGMIPPQQVPGKVDAPPPDDSTSPLLTDLNVKESATGRVETSTTEPMKALANTLKTSQTIPAEDVSSTTLLPPAPGADDKAAKVAAIDFALPKTEALPAGNFKEEGRATGIASLSPHTPVTIARNDAALKIETPVHDRAWANDFSQKIVWLATSDKQSAQLTLNPPQMGPIEISLTISKDSASAFFVSQNAEVREAIETALPRLREMLAGAGIELGQAHVGAESFRQQMGNEEARQGAPRWRGDNAILAGDSGHSLAGQTITTQRGNSLVDIFA